MKKNLKQLLEEAGEIELRALVLSIYGNDKRVDKLIEAALLASDTPPQVKHIAKQIQSLDRHSHFIPYDQSFEFSRTLDQLITQIDSLLRSDPKSAFELTDQFINTHENVYEHCDDSDGSVGECYRVARNLWLAAAKAWQNSDQLCDLDWAEEIRKRHNNNDYAVWDSLIENSFAVLGESKLHELGLHYETSLKELVAKRIQGYNPDLSSAKLGLMGVAQALGDVAMFERSYLISDRELNDLQKQNIAEFCLTHEDPKSALKWLDGECHERFVSERERLIDQAYSMLGDSSELLRLRRNAYESEPGFEQLQALLATAPKSEKESLNANAVDRARTVDNINVAVATLIKLQAIKESADYIVQHQDKLQYVSHYTLAVWVTFFESKQCYLASVLIYRVLLLEILQAGRSTAYRHAAKYYTALQRLDEKINNYQSWTDHTKFVQGLTKTHGRKRSFWSLVG